jgi:hypothetical protein
MFTGLGGHPEAASSIVMVMMAMSPGAKKYVTWANCIATLKIVHDYNSGLFGLSGARHQTWWWFAPQSRSQSNALAPPVRIPPSRPDTMVQAGSSTTSIPAI